MVDVARIDRKRVNDPSYEIIIDDLSEDIASVRLYSDGWVDYLHVVKARGEWKLLHAAYTESSNRTDERNPEDGVEITARHLLHNRGFAGLEFVGFEMQGHGSILQDDG